MIGIRMHRLARTRYAGSLAPHVSDGETLSDPRLIAERLNRVTGAWEEATPELLEEGSVELDDAELTVEFTKREAPEGQQLPGAWRVTAIATSSDQEVVVGWVSVEVVG